MCECKYKTIMQKVINHLEDVKRIYLSGTVNDRIIGYVDGLDCAKNEIESAMYKVDNEEED